MKAEFKDGCLVITIPTTVRIEADEPLAALTPREREVLEQLRRGMCNKEIAAKMGIALRTVKYFVSEILRKTHCTNRVQVVGKYPNESSSQ